MTFFQNAQPLLTSRGLTGPDLFFAAGNGDLAQVRNFIEGIGSSGKSISVNAVDASGNTALHWAAYKNHPQVVEYLLSMGGNAQSENNAEGQTPLHWACVAGHYQCVKLLLQLGTQYFPLESLFFDLFLPVK